MRSIILDKAADAGLDFAKYDRKEDEELDQDTLRDAIMTDHVTPDEIAEAFVISALENLGFENDLKQRREDKIKKAADVLHEFMPPSLARKVAETIIDAMSGALVKEVEG